MASTEEISGHEIGGEEVNADALFSPPSEGVGILCGGGYGAFKYAASTFGGGAECYSGGCDDEGTDEEYAGHEFAGICVNPDAQFLINIGPQEVGCGNGYAGGQFAALMYGGGVPCNFMNPVSSTEARSNTMELCVLDYTCISTVNSYSG